MKKLMHRRLLLAVSLCLLAFVSRTAWGAIAIDVKIVKNQGSTSSSVTTTAFSTTAPNELLLAFVSADNASSPNTTVTSVTGGGLTWVLVERTNVQKGTAEVWRAFSPTVLSNVTVKAALSQSVASSMTVMSFSGVSTSGTNGSGAIGAVGTGNANPGAPTATLVTQGSGLLVLGVGNDWDNAIGRTLGPNQTLLNQYFAPLGDTYWVQMQSSAIPVSGASVTINNTAPTGDRYNLSTVEILAALAGGSTWTISGAITGDSGNATVTLSQNGTTIATTSTISGGGYTFGNITNGTYAVSATKAGFAINPTSQTAVVNNANATVPAFTESPLGWMVSGAITGDNGNANVILSQNGNTIAAVVTTSGGGYSFPNIVNGSYSVSASKTGYTISPPSQSVTVNNANATVSSFTETPLGWMVSGTITGDNGGATLTLTQNGSTVGTAITQTGGGYSFANILNGTYILTPTKSGTTFSPPNQTITVNGQSLSVPSFTEQVNLLYPDLKDILPPGMISVVQTPSGRQFQYTHDTLNNGPGPLVIQPAFNSASGAYQGTQYIYSQDSSGKWTLSQQLPIAGAFLFDSDHGHFHFPFVTYGLYSVGPNGGPGTPMATSEKVSFCIDDSFIYEPNIPNAGALGNLGSCSDPTSLRGLDIGAVDEYDQTDAGQAISIGSLPDGTYWLRALVDPNNFLFEADKTNNETDVELTITGTTVQVLQTVYPVLNPPPEITLTSPNPWITVSGVVQLTASTTMTSGVQFLVDGQNFGNVVQNIPYSLSWDTTTLPNGVHWLAVQTTDPTGIIGTSPVVQVTVSNVTNTAPVVQLSSPADGSIVSATTSIYATVGSSEPISNVVFNVDYSPIGSVATAPYMIQWNSTNVTDGQHVITVTATDALGNVGNSVPVNLNVDNSHPPNVISEDVAVSVDGAGVLTTPKFSTATASDLLVAFVAYDGPAGSSQLTNVSGAGLTWTLLTRSNTQSGTAEVWSARADGLLSGVTVTSLPQVGSNYHGSLTVIAFINAYGTSVVNRTGMPSGAPDIFLPGVIAGDWVFAVGNDWDNAIARAPVSGQVIVHQKTDTQVGDTYWVQSTATPASANALVDIHDSSPTSDRWNYAAVEIVATHN